MLKLSCKGKNICEVAVSCACSEIVFFLFRRYLTPGILEERGELFCHRWGNILLLGGRQRDQWRRYRELSTIHSSPLELAADHQKTNSKVCEEKQTNVGWQQQLQLHHQVELSRLKKVSKSWKINEFSNPMGDHNTIITHPPPLMVYLHFGPRI